MSYEVRPEPGETYALIGECELVIKGIGHQMRKGHIVITDRRVAFCGRYAINSVFHAVAHAAGKGRVDLSVPYSMIEEAEKGSVMSGFHLLITYIDEANKKQVLKVKLNRWGKAIDAVHAGGQGLKMFEVGETAIGEISFLPIAGDFLELGIAFVHWKQGRGAADEWVNVINSKKAGPSEIKVTPMVSAKCPSCGKEIEPNWLACPHCQVDIEAKCARCGEPIQPEFVECPVCGLSFI